MMRLFSASEAEESQSINVIYMSAITFEVCTRNHTAINKLRINMAPRGMVAVRLRQHIGFQRHHPVQIVFVAMTPLCSGAAPPLAVYQA